MALQIRRGTTAQRVAKTFVEGEIIYDTVLQAVFVGDGITPGGKSVSIYTDIEATDAVGTALVNGSGNVVFTKVSDTQINASVTLDGGLLDVVQDTSPQLGGNLDLNSRSITGSGIINIVGDVTATTFHGALDGNASTVTNGIYTNHTFFIGTEQIGIGRSSNAQTLQGVSITGNSATATTLASSRNIQGVAFNGSADVTVLTAGTGVTVSGTQVSIGQAVATTSDVTFNDIIVAGALTVNGTTTTINSTVLDVVDKNITVAKGAADAASANGAGLTVDGAGATILYVSSGDKFEFNKPVQASSFIGNVTGTASSTTGNAATATKLAATKLINGVAFDGSADINITANASTLSGTSLNSTVVDSSLTTVGTLSSLTVSGTTTTNDVVTDGLSTTSVNDEGIVANSAFTVRQYLTANGGFEVNAQGGTDGTYAILVDPTLVSVGAPLNIGRTGGVTAKLTADRVTFGAPVQFGRYTTSQIVGLTTTLEALTITTGGGFTVIEFEEQANILFEIGSNLVINLSSPVGASGAFTVTGSTRFSVTVAGAAGPVTTVDAVGTVIGGIPNGTVVYDTTVNQFKGYANGAWVVFSTVASGQPL